MFREADIQALKEAMQLTRQESIQALKHTAGDVNKAFINELSAFDLRLDIVDNLVRNYAAQRQASLPCQCTFVTSGTPKAATLKVICCIGLVRMNHSSIALRFHPAAGC